MNDSPGDGSQKAGWARFAMVIQIVGVSDVALGIGAALFGPALVAGIDEFWWLTGGFIAALGLGLIVWGRHTNPENRTR